MQDSLRFFEVPHGRGAEPDSQTRKRFRLSGWTCLMLSFMACIGANGSHIGPVLWCSIFTVSAIVLRLLLHYVPQKALRLAQIGYLAAPTLAASWLLR